MNSYPSPDFEVWKRGFFAFVYWASAVGLVYFDYFLVGVANDHHSWDAGETTVVIGIVIVVAMLFIAGCQRPSLYNKWVRVAYSLVGAALLLCDAAVFWQLCEAGFMEEILLRIFAAITLLVYLFFRTAKAAPSPFHIITDQHGMEHPTDLC